MNVVPPLLCLNAKIQGFLIDPLRWAVTYGSVLARATKDNSEVELATRR
jgi:hypothetical protein